METGLVSVIIPTYNRGKWIIRSIRSVENQKYSNYEILICDDHSTDNTLDIVRDYINQGHEKIYLLEGEQGKKGANCARNNGIKHARGEFIVFLDSDDTLTENSISDRIDIFSNSDIDMVYGDVIVGDVYHKYDVIQNFKQNEYLMEELSLCCFIVIMIRKSVFDTIPLLDENLRSWQDDSFVLSLNQHKKKMFHCGYACARIYRVDESISTNYDNWVQGLSSIFEKYKRDILNEKGIFRVFLWRLRIYLDVLLSKASKTHCKMTYYFYIVLIKILKSYLKTNFRHIYG